MCEREKTKKRKEEKQKEESKKKKKTERKIERKEKKMTKVITTEEVEKNLEMIKRLTKIDSEEERKKELKKIVYEFDREERENCTTEIYFYKKIARVIERNKELCDYLKIRLRELEKEFKLSEQEELIRFWVADILFDLHIIDFLSSDVATEWLLESQECEIELVRRKNG